MSRPEADSIIRVADLRRSFGGVVALDGASLSVREGEIFGLLGPDGAGKTTLMRILCGLIPADSGAVTVAGHDVLAHPEAVKPELGYLPQRFAQYSDLTVEENLRFTARLFGVSRDEYERHLPELLAITRMAPFTGRLAGNLSGGMKQKLALMCCLIHRPRVLLLDEPTTGVDPASRRDFWSLLQTLPAQGVTVLVSTPYMDEAERCDRLALLYQGQVLACDTPAGLKSLVGGKLFSLGVRPQRAARDLLEKLPAVGAVIVFGDRLHVSTGEDMDVESLLEPLRAADVQIEEAEPLEPGLEDAFAELVRRRRTGD